MSKAKRNGGYALVDFTGVSLMTFQTEQPTANPVYEPILKAIANGKPVYAENLTVGTSVVSPVNVPFYRTGNAIQGIISTFAIVVGHTDAGDGVIITPMQ